MALDMKPGPPGEDEQLFIDLDLDGLAALLRAVEAALATGRGHLACESAGGRGISVRSGASHDFDRVTVTFSRRSAPDRPEQEAAAPPRVPAR